MHRNDTTENICGRNPLISGRLIAWKETEETLYLSVGLITHANFLLARCKSQFIQLNQYIQDGIPFNEIAFMRNNYDKQIIFGVTFISTCAFYLGIIVVWLPHLSNPPNLSSIQQNDFRVRLTDTLD